METSNQTVEKPKKQTVRGFVRDVKKRINQHRFLNIVWWTIAIAGTAMLVIALAYVWPGYQVPIYWYAIVAAAGLVGGLLAWLFNRANEDHAAHFADEFFGFKDSVRSCSNFANAGLDGDFYQLQSDQTEELVAESSVDKIRYQPPYRLAVLAVLLTMIAIALGFKGPSDEVVKREAEQAATAKLTTTLNQEIRDLIDELDSSLDDEEERKLLDPDKLREWVDELEETQDKKEAMRQYAKLERKIQKASDALQQKKDEKLLDRAAEELKKDEESKKLAKLLEQKKYEKAGDELRDLKPDEGERPDKKLSEKRRELAKLRAAARRMADAARNKAGGKKQNGNRNANDSDQNGQARDGKSGAKSSDEMAEGDPMEDQGELAEMIEDLEEALEEFDGELEEMEFVEREEGEEQNLEQCERCEQCEGEFERDLDELAKKLKRMAKRRAAAAKLKALGKKCAECQGGIAQMRVRSPGGKKAGQGTDDTMREERDEQIDNGQYTKLKGLKGKGPSLTKIESADDGTGISGRTAEAKQREFKRQFESFVEREDVPEDLKTGVKNYFTHIHENSTDSAVQEIGDGEDEK